MANRVHAGASTGRSMEPAILAGDVIVFDAEPGPVHVGDVLVFGNCVHRAVWLDPLGGIWERGDNPGCAPRRRRRDEVSGRVVGVVRDGVWLEPSTHVPRRLLVARGIASRVAGAVVARARSFVLRRGWRGRA